MSITFGWRCQTVVVTMPRAVKLSVSMEVEVCGSPVSPSDVRGGGFLAVGEEACDFGFSCQGDDVLRYVCNGVNGAVWRRYCSHRIGGVLSSVTKVLVAANAAASFGVSEVQVIAGDV